MDKTYSVALSNKDCIFDEATGFATIEEAIEWSTGRGYPYVAYFGASDAGDHEISVAVQGADNYRVDNAVYTEQYSAAELAAYLERNLW